MNRRACPYCTDRYPLSHGRHLLPNGVELPCVAIEDAFSDDVQREPKRTIFAHCFDWIPDLQRCDEHRAVRSSEDANKPSAGGSTQLARTHGVPAQEAEFGLPDDVVVIGWDYGR